jgi:hypothetical protein
MTVISNLARIKTLAENGLDISEEDVRTLMGLVSRTFKKHLVDNGFDSRQITRLTTKLRDAGRRSPPWKPHSNRVPGRPQDGADGNRTNRWLLDSKHKFYATEIIANLVEIKYYLQCLSMEGAPALPNDDIRTCFSFILEHNVEPGLYLDPIQMVPIPLSDVIDNARVIQSGHLVPLDRGGKHEPPNTFLMLARSNQLQGNLTVDELYNLMTDILHKHGRI